MPNALSKFFRRVRSPLISLQKGAVQLYRDLFVPPLTPEQEEGRARLAAIPKRSLFSLIFDREEWESGKLNVRMPEVTYKGYVARLQPGDGSGILCGRVIGIKDVIVFKGKNFKDFQKSFEDSIEDYLEFCEELGREPNPPSKKR